MNTIAHAHACIQMCAHMHSFHATYACTHTCQCKHSCTHTYTLRYISTHSYTATQLINYSATSFILCTEKGLFAQSSQREAPGKPQSRDWCLYYKAAGVLALVLGSMLFRWETQIEPQLLINQEFLGNELGDGGSFSFSPFCLSNKMSINSFLKESEKTKRYLKKIVETTHRPISSRARTGTYPSSGHTCEQAKATCISMDGPQSPTGEVLNKIRKAINNRTFT